MRSFLAQAWIPSSQSMHHHRAQLNQDRLTLSAFLHKLHHWPDCSKGAAPLPRIHSPGATLQRAGRITLDAERVINGIGAGEAPVDPGKDGA